MRPAGARLVPASALRRAPAALVAPCARRSRRPARMSADAIPAAQHPGTGLLDLDGAVVALRDPGPPHESGPAAGGGTAEASLRVPTSTGAHARRFTGERMARSGEAPGRHTAGRLPGRDVAGSRHGRDTPVGRREPSARRAPEPVQLAVRVDNQGESVDNGCPLWTDVPRRRWREPRRPWSVCRGTEPAATRPAAVHRWSTPRRPVRPSSSTGRGRSSTASAPSPAEWPSTASTA